MRAAPLIALALLSLVLPGAASAAGGSFRVEGGDAYHRAQVRAALDASAFDWDVIPREVTVHVVPGVRPFATPGHVWIDPLLLEAGMFSWGVVQDEFAHQVDFLVLDEPRRDVLARRLGGEAWCHADRPGLPHASYACERFTSMLVWSYWPVAANPYRPASPSDESAAMPPARFRRLVDALIWPDRFELSLAATRAR